MEVILRWEGLTLAGPGATEEDVEDAAAGGAALAAALSGAALGAVGFGGEAAESAVQALRLHRHLWKYVAVPDKPICDQSLATNHSVSLQTAYVMYFKSALSNTN